MAKLYSSIGLPENITVWSETAKSITSYSAESRDKFTAAIEKQVGAHGFMIFQVYLSFSLPLIPLYPIPSP